MSDPQAAIDVRDLVVEYGKGGKKTRAVQGISFTVERGECVGFIGVNGAGKSTTIKSLLGFIFPSSGSIEVLGLPPGRVASRQRIGYLPEVALYYPFMKARELMKLYGGLHGLKGADLKRRSEEALAKVGLGGKEDILLKNFSKGMQQRLGIAQSLIADPDLLIFDELSSGLDPVGRHDLRQLLLELKRAGKTIFFSSHELTEVETLCDRVIIIHRGEIVKAAPLSDLMQPLNQFEITFRPHPGGGALPEEIVQLDPERDGEQLRVMVNDTETYAQILHKLTEARCEVVRTSSRSVSLEDYYIQLVRERER